MMISRLLRALRASEKSHRRIRHEENNLDPDDRNSLLCSACMLPIFSTRVVNININDNMHDQCANLPDKLLNNVLHPGKPLFLQPNLSIFTSCYGCRSKCGSIMYKCPDIYCRFQLDIKCAVTIRVLHRSHHHTLAATRGSASFVCGACGTQHRGLSSMSYLCNACDFWIHPDCASLDNVINLRESHIHPLLLTYALPKPFDQDVVEPSPKCNICGELIGKFGVYFCNSCGYYAHIMCATSNPVQRFTPVLIREAKLANLSHFPITNEYVSVIRYIMDDTSGGGGGSGGACSSGTSDREQLEYHPSEGELFPGIHEHLLIFHGDDDDYSSKVCNGCIQLISPPFYTCSQCKDFFLHNSCAHLPSKLIDHKAHKKHPLLLSTKIINPFDSKFVCSACMRHSNGFSYSCNICEFALDVVCASMPSSITHDAHGRSHVLHLSRNNIEKCHCCRLSFGAISYECSSCLNFKLHAKCALFPNTLSHKFDPHPLELTTVPRASQDQQQQFCEVCEQYIKIERWHYNCNICTQSFHINCIPAVDRLSKMKLGVTIHVTCHDCPLTSIRVVMIDGYRCGYCQKVIRDSHGTSHGDREIAFECVKCYFRIHEICAKKCFINDVV